MSLNIINSFIPALKDLNQADPLELFEKLLKVNIVIAAANGEQLVAIWHSLNAFTAIYNFTAQQLTIIHSMRATVKTKANSLVCTSRAHHLTLLNEITES
jgi:hypothetical protein